MTIHDPVSVTSECDTYKGVALCSCGNRFVEYARTFQEAEAAARRVLSAHLASKGEPPIVVVTKTEAPESQ